MVNVLVDIEGRVSNIDLAVSRALLPVFEAVVNSFQAIQDLPSPNDCYIKIHVIRDEIHVDMDTEIKQLGRIIGFRIEDNGIGFTEENYNSFDTSDSTFKKTRGGKGVGRLLWLKAFEKVEIESYYSQGIKAMYRKFRFSIPDNGIGNCEIVEARYEGRKTIVSLNSFLKKYSDACPKKLDTIAIRVIEHCLLYFLDNNCPQVEIIDSDERLILNKIFREMFSSNANKVQITLKGENFTLIHFRLYSSEEASHRIHLCANEREVLSKKLTYYIPYLQKKIRDDAGRFFVYAGYVFGDYLNQNVNQQRTGFNFAEDSDIEFSDHITLENLFSGCAKEIKDYLE